MAEGMRILVFTANHLHALRQQMLAYANGRYPAASILVRGTQGILSSDLEQADVIVVYDKDRFIADTYRSVIPSQQVDIYTDGKPVAPAAPPPPPDSKPTVPTKSAPLEEPELKEVEEPEAEEPEVRKKETLEERRARLRKARRKARKAAEQE